jgi:molecular chaperone DnaK
MQGNAFMTTVHLEPKRSNGFSIACLDAQGRKVPVEPDTFSIAQGIMVSEPPLARSIVVAARDDDSVVGLRLLDRGVSLPATGRQTFRTDTAVNPGEVVDALNIHVFEGEYEAVHLNRHVGFMQIRGNEISRYVPVNTPVEVTIKVDSSRKATVRAYIPLLDQTFEQVLTGQVCSPETPRKYGRGLIRSAIALNPLQKYHHEIKSGLSGRRQKSRVTLNSPMEAIKLWRYGRAGEQTNSRMRSTGSWRPIRSNYSLMK